MSGASAPVQVVLGLGSNRGNSLAIIQGALRALEEVLAELKSASLYETEPLHVTDQNRFLNTAVSGFFGGSPRELLERVQEIEARFGRDRSRERRWGERTLDIDILLFGNLRVREAADAPSPPPALIVPHPRLKERRFALEPLLELLPCALDPETGVSYRDIRDALPDQGVMCIGALKISEAADAP